MSTENLLKYFRSPYPEDQDEWERILKKDRFENGSDWLGAFYESKVGGNTVGETVETMANRCADLEIEIAIWENRTNLIANRCSQLANENTRLREALERIVNCDTTAEGVDYPRSPFMP